MRLTVSLAGKLKMSRRGVKITLAALAVGILGAEPVLAQAKKRSWESLKGNWSQKRSCIADGSSSWILLKNTIQSKEMLCAIEERNPIKDGWSLFLQCKSEAISKGAIVSYMGQAIVVAQNQLKLELSEYRGGTGAPDLRAILYRCGN